MDKFGRAFLISVLLHVGLIALAYISWTIAPKPVTVSSVPIQIVSDMPSQQMAEAPVDELAVKNPEPIPSPPEPVKSEPIPAPPLPIPQPVKLKPEPVKPQVKPEPKPEPKPEKSKPTQPDKDGLKKTTPKPDTKKTSTAKATAKPAQQPTKDDFLGRLAATPSQAPTRRPAQAATRRTTGISARGSGPADAGLQTSLDQLGQRLQRQWIVNCDVPGSQMVNPEIKFTLSPNGRVINLDWVNRRSDPVWVAGANLAMGAVNKGQPYQGLPDGLYNRPITFVFSAEEACRGQ